MGHQLLLDTSRDKSEEEQFLYANYAPCSYYCTGERLDVHSKRDKPCECRKDHHADGKSQVCRILNCTICKKIEEREDETQAKVKSRKTNAQAGNEGTKRIKRKADEISDDEEEVYPNWLLGVSDEVSDEEEQETGYLLTQKPRGKAGGKAGGKSKASKKK